MCNPCCPDSKIFLFSLSTLSPQTDVNSPMVPLWTNCCFLKKHHFFPVWMAPANNEASVITFQLQTASLWISFHLDLTQSVWSPFKCNHFASHSESTFQCVCVCVCLQYSIREQSMCRGKTQRETINNMGKKMQGRILGVSAPWCDSDSHIMLVTYMFKCLYTPDTSDSFLN